MLAGDREAAQAQLKEALQVADELGERVYLPQLWLLEAALARAQGQRSAGAACTRLAIEEARAQESPWIELLALVDLGEHHALDAAERQALEALVDRLPEAHDTPAVSKARLMLAKT